MLALMCSATPGLCLATRGVLAGGRPPPAIVLKVTGCSFPEFHGNETRISHRRRAGVRATQLRPSAASSNRRSMCPRKVGRLRGKHDLARSSAVALKIRPGAALPNLWRGVTVSNESLGGLCDGRARLSQAGSIERRCLNVGSLGVRGRAPKNVATPHVTRRSTQVARQSTHSRIFSLQPKRQHPGVVTFNRNGCEATVSQPSIYLRLWNHFDQG